MASSSLLPISLAVVVALMLLGGAHAAPLNITGILDKAQQYSTFIRLLTSNQVSSQLENQLNNSNTGLTIFAPTDNAFSKLKPGALNSLSAQQQTAFLLYHVLPTFYTFATIQTASNPIRTQAAGNDGGVFTFNITASTNSNQFNISTGVNNVTVSNAVNITSPLAIFVVDEVLLPTDLFGPKPPPAAPAPASSAPGNSSTGNSTKPAANGPSAPNAGFKVKGVEWGSVVLISLGILSFL